MKATFLKAAIVALAAAAPAAQAAPEVATRLVSALAAVAPGGTLDLAIEQTLAPGWHTYWRNPGDSGEALSMEWKLPAGAEAAALAWPVPARFATGPVMTYGYKGKVTFLTGVSVPSDWPVGRPFEVAVDIYALICSDICIPVETSLTLAVPTAAKAEPAEAVVPLFVLARRQIPGECPWQPSVRSTEGGMRLQLAGGAGAFAGVGNAYFFAETWGVVKHAGVQNAEVTDRTLVLDLPGGQVPFGGELSGVVSLRAASGANPTPGACRIEARALGQ